MVLVEVKIKVPEQELEFFKFVASTHPKGPEDHYCYGEDYSTPEGIIEAIVKRAAERAYYNMVPLMLHKVEINDGLKVITQPVDY